MALSLVQVGSSKWRRASRIGKIGLEVRSSIDLTDFLYHSEKGPLPEAVVDACEEVWEKVKGRAHKYWL